MHLRTLSRRRPPTWRDEALAAKWDKVRDIRRVVTGALELARADKKIGASLQAHPIVHLTPERRAMLDGVDLSEISITSGITLSATRRRANGAFTLPDVPGVAVAGRPGRAASKCERCWQVLPEVGSHAHHPTCAIAAPTWSRAWRVAHEAGGADGCSTRCAALRRWRSSWTRSASSLVFRVLMVNEAEIG